MQHEQFEHPTVANTKKNERFKLQNGADTVEMATSSSKTLQMAGKTGKKTDQKQIPKRETIIPKTIPDPYFLRITISI